MNNDKTQELKLKRHVEWQADTTARKYGTPFSAWMAASYPAEWREWARGTVYEGVELVEAGNPASVATPAAASAGAAGTIRARYDVLFQAMAVRYRNEDDTKERWGALADRADELIAAAVAEAEKRGFEQGYKTAKGMYEHVSKKLTAATAPVSAAEENGAAQNAANSSQTRMEAQSKPLLDVAARHAAANEVAVREKVAHTIDHDAFWTLVAQCRNAQPGADYREKSEKLVVYVNAWAGRPAATIAGGQELPALSDATLIELWKGSLKDDMTDVVGFARSCIAMAMRQPQGDELADVRALIASDSYAISFQSFGQYRSALLKFIAAKQAGKE